METVIINGKEFVEATQTTETKDGLTYCIVRTYSAGVWAGYVDLDNFGKVLKVTEARRLWRWWSEFTLSALAMHGHDDHHKNENKYAMPVPVVYFSEVIEVIPCTDVAKDKIISIPDYNED